MSRHTAQRDPRPSIESQSIEDLRVASDDAWRAYFELRNAYADAYAAFMRAKDAAYRADMALIKAMDALSRDGRESKP